MEKYLGIDWGEKRIGLATADEETGLSLPLGTVPNLAGVLQTIIDEEITTIVIGRPYKIGGLDIKLSPDYLKFLELLTAQITIPIHEIDERFSSKEADAMGGPKNMRAGRDEIAAALILQSYLDRYGRK
ncbi:MAG: Holliday junction resolvase RuvX [Patescibacteria group bacterium]